MVNDRFIEGLIRPRPIFDHMGQKDRKRHNKIVSFMVRILMVILLVFFIWNRDGLGIFTASLILLAGFLPSILKRDKIPLPWHLNVLLSSAVLLHVGGHALGAYLTIPGYDTITHFVSSIFVSLFAFTIVFILDEYWDDLHMNAYSMAFIVVIFTIAVGVFWEFTEWMSDSLFNTNMQTGLDNTMKDLVVDTIAGILVATFGVGWVKKGKFKEITKDFGEEINRKIINKPEIDNEPDLKDPDA